MLESYFEIWVLGLAELLPQSFDLAVQPGNLGFALTTVEIFEFLLEIFVLHILELHCPSLGLQIVLVLLCLLDIFHHFPQLGQQCLKWSFFAPSWIFQLSTEL